MTEYFEFLYNGEFGVFEFSEKFKNVYKITTGKDLDNKNLSMNLRSDPVILKLVKLLGLKNSQGNFSQFEIRIFPKKFIKYIKICESDGYETPYIDIYQYIIDTVLSANSQEFWYVQEEIKECTTLNKYGIKI